MAQVEGSGVDVGAVNGDRAGPNAIEFGGLISPMSTGRELIGSVEDKRTGVGSVNVPVEYSSVPQQSGSQTSTDLPPIL